MVGLVFTAVLGYGARTMLAPEAKSPDEGRHIIADASSSPEYFDTEDHADSGSDHAYHSFDALMIEEQDPVADLPHANLPAVSVSGPWEALLADDSTAGHLIRNDCSYALSGLRLTLRQSESQIVGTGDYSLSADDCTRGVTALSAYAVATGILNPPYVKLTIRESQDGPGLFVFYGTASPEGILGQVRTMDGQLLLEHVTLTAPRK